MQIKPQWDTTIHLLKELILKDKLYKVHWGWRGNITGGSNVKSNIRFGKQLAVSYKVKHIFTTWSKHSIPKDLSNRN